MSPSLTPQSLPPEFLGRGISLGQIMAMLNAYRIAIVISAVVAMVMAGLISKLVLKKSYDATATVLVDYEVNAPDTNREFPSQLAEGYMKTQLAFVGSAAVLGPVLDALGWMSNADKKKGYVGPPEGLREHLMWKVLYENLALSNPQDSRFIYISYSAESAAEAAKVANAVADHYVREHGERLRSPAKSRADEYQKSLDEFKTRFIAAQAAVAEFRKRTGLVDLDGSGQMEAERLRELNSALLLAESDQRNAAIRSRQVSRLRSGAVDSDVEYASSPGVVRIREDLLTAEARFSELQKVLGPRHPDYLVAEAQVRELRQKLQGEVSGYGGGVVDNASAAAGQSSALVGSLRSRIEEEQQRLLNVRGQQDEVARLLSERDAAEKLYKLALDEYGQIIRSAETQYNDVSLVAPAVPPVRHTKPKASVNVVIGFIGGLICAALVCLLIELRRRRVRCAEDLEVAFAGLPLMVIGGKST